MKFEEFRRICLSHPEVEERETWGEATFRVRGKIFAMGSPEGRIVSIKASLDDQAGLIALDPKTFSVSAYTGRFGWVSVRLAGFRGPLAEQVIRSAWERTAPRRMLASRTPSDGSRRGLRPAGARAARGSLPR